MLIRFFAPGLKPRFFSLNVGLKAHSYTVLDNTNL
jgi:hypothetical protein